MSSPRVSVRLCARAPSYRNRAAVRSLGMTCDARVRFRLRSPTATPRSTVCAPSWSPPTATGKTLNWLGGTVGGEPKLKQRDPPPRALCRRRRVCWWRRPSVCSGPARWSSFLPHRPPPPLLSLTSGPVRRGSVSSATFPPSAPQSISQLVSFGPIDSSPLPPPLTGRYLLLSAFANIGA